MFVLNKCFFNNFSFSTILAVQFSTILVIQGVKIYIINKKDKIYIYSIKGMKNLILVKKSIIGKLTSA